MESIQNNPLVFDVVADYQYTPEKEGDGDLQVVLEHFYGYCSDKDGFHTPPLDLYGGLEALQYVKLQIGLQYRVIVTDTEDNICVEAIAGEIVFPCEYMSLEHSVPV